MNEPTPKTWNSSQTADVPPPNPEELTAALSAIQNEVARCTFVAPSRPTDPDAMGIRMGTFDGDPGVRPGFRQYVADAAPWEPIPDDGLPRYPAGRGAGPPAA